MAYAAAADVQAILGKELTPETALVERRLAQVEPMSPADLAAQIDAGDLDEADVIDIEAEAVLRLVRTPRATPRSQTGRTRISSTAMQPAASWRSSPRSGRHSASSRVGCSLSCRISLHR